MSSSSSDSERYIDCGHDYSSDVDREAQCFGDRKSGNISNKIHVEIYTIFVKIITAMI